MQLKLSVPEVADLLGITKQAVRKQIREAKLKAELVNNARGGRAGQSYVVPVSSLPTEAQRRFWTSNEVAAAAEVQPSEKEPDLSEGITYSLAELENAVGKERFQAMLAAAEQRIELIERAKTPPVGMDKTEWVKHLADVHGRSVASIYLDMKKFEEFGVVGLMRKSRLLTQGPQRTSIPFEVERFIRGTYLDRKKPKPAKVLKKMTEFCETKGYEIPSRASVYRYLKDMETYEPDLCCLAREGPEAYMKKFAEMATREEPAYVNQVWMGDHHKLDLFISHGGRAIRPWITVWFDVCSRVVVGWCLSAGANGRTIALALRHAMLPKVIRTKDEEGNDVEETIELGGLPGMLYIDNGEDYKSQVKDGKKHEDWELSRETRGICAQFDIKVQFATPYHPQAKAHVERWFRTFTEQFTSDLPGWCGANNMDRPEGFDEKKLHEQGKLLNLDELSEKIEAYLYEYHTTRHSQIQTEPLHKHFSTPKIREGWPEERALDICLMDVESAAVTGSGIKRFSTRGKTRWFWHDDLPAFAGQKVIIKYDPNRIGELLVFNPKTKKYVFTATNKELLAFNATKEDVQELHKRRANRRKVVKQLIQDAKIISLEDVVEERKAAGTQRKSGQTGMSKKGVQVMVGTEQVVKQREGRTTPSKPRKPDKVSAMDAYILREGTEG
ncbi:Mu transposase C-terminal domain-containing protein [Paenibacillus dendritiformis]|uniref:Mu transposase C-terminal domain-containing protein n=1 Tax=Paenibacillus dendritiformis TaxID=130049 RepID=UPI0015EB65B2|nr:Mu transposase C-terminal domain-containing protein [Paenibacillus dendritiformis]